MGGKAKQGVFLEGKRRNEMKEILWGKMAIGVESSRHGTPPGFRGFVTPPQSRQREKRPETHHVIVLQSAYSAFSICRCSCRIAQG